MIVHTPAIVLKSFPYGDTSLIARCFSKEQGKISLIIKGARSKKSNRASYFQPLSYVDLIYNYSSKRELQILSKVNFIEYWSNILNDLRSISLTMAIIELTDETITNEDPNQNLFSSLRDVLKAYNENKSDPNLLFWFYECALLTHLGFKPNLEINNLPGVVLPNLDQSANSVAVIASLLANDINNLPDDPITKRDSNIISEYLWLLLCYHFDGVQQIKSIATVKEILSE